MAKSIRGSDHGRRSKAAPSPIEHLSFGRGPGRKTQLEAFHTRLGGLLRERRLNDIFNLVAGCEEADLPQAFPFDQLLQIISLRLNSPQPHSAVPDAMLAQMRRLATVLKNTAPQSPETLRMVESTRTLPGNLFAMAVLEVFASPVAGRAVRGGLACA